MTITKELLDLQGCKIKFSTLEGDYEGEVTLVSPVSNKVMVDKTFFYTSTEEKVFMGRLIFLFHEITSFNLISRLKGNAEVKINECTASHKNLGNQSVPYTLIEDDEDDVESLRDWIDSEEEYVLRLPSNQNKVPLDFVTFNFINDEFYHAINHIKEQSSIGIALEGPKIDRHGIVSWLNVSTSHCTFLFDIQALGKTVFDNGLRDILQNPDIKKIFHDCRQASDCLHHMFGCELVNVFDTQVADKFVMMQKSRDGKFDNHVNSLNSCLRTYLDIPEEFLYRSKTVQSVKDSIISFQLRPVQQRLQDVMMKNVIYLRILREKLEDLLLNPFHRAVEVYLNVMRSANDQELLLEPSVPEKIPNQLLLEEIQVVKFREFIEMPRIVHSGPPYRDTSNPIKNFVKCCELNDIIENNLRNQEKANVNALQNNSAFDCNSVFTKPKMSDTKENIPLICKTKKLDLSCNSICENGRSDLDEKPLSQTASHNASLTETEKPRVPERSLDVKKNISELKGSTFNLMKMLEMKKRKDSSNMNNFNSVNRDNHSHINVNSNTPLQGSSLDIKTAESSVIKLEQELLSEYNKSSRQEINEECPKTSEFENADQSSCADPWAKLRDEFTKSYGYDVEEATKYRFIPAGMD